MSSSTGVRLAIIGLIIAGTIVYRVFFVDSDEVLNFNDQLVDFVEESDKRFVPMGELLDQYAAGNEADVEHMKRVQADLADKIRRDKDQLAAMTVPDDDLCREFHGACVEYVDNSLQLASKYASVIAYIAEHNPASTEEDQTAVHGMISDLLARDETLLDAVSEIQRRMAKKFDLELK